MRESKLDARAGLNIAKTILRMRKSKTLVAMIINRSPFLPTNIIPRMNMAAGKKKGMDTIALCRLTSKEITT